MKRTGSIPYYSGDALAGLGIVTVDVIKAIETIVGDRARGRAWDAPIATIRPNDGRFFGTSMGVVEDPAIVVVKTNVANPKNTAGGLPQINGAAVVLNAVTGNPIALMDGNWITAVRTAALSALAAKRLARPEAEVAAFIGAGVQARSHLQSLSELYPLKLVQVFGRGSRNIDILCDMAEGLGLRTRVCASAQDAVTGADVVVSAITWSENLAAIDAGTMKPGAFATITDLGAPWNRESFGAFDRVITGDRGIEVTEGVPVFPTELVTGTLDDLVLGRCAGRQSADERCAFVSRGYPLADTALVSLACRLTKVV